MRTRTFVSSKTGLVFLAIAVLAMPGIAAAQDAVKGSGCVEAGVENSCLVLRDLASGTLYNLFFNSKPGAKVGDGISFSGTRHSGPTICMQGEAVDVQKWSTIRIQCPQVNPKTSAESAQLVFKVVGVQLTLIKTNPPQLAITAIGQIPSGGWTNAHLSQVVYATPPADGMQDFDFTADPPKGPSTANMAPILAIDTMPAIPSWLIGVRTRGKTNSMEAFLKGIPEVEIK